MFCKEQVAQLGEMVVRIHDAGAELVVIGNGSPEQAGSFVEGQAVEMPVYTDPTLEVYRAVGARKGVLTILHPKTIVSWFRSLRMGFRQSSIQGSAMQQGGVFVVMPNGSVPYRYLARAAGDHPRPDVVLKALTQATGSGS